LDEISFVDLGADTKTTVKVVATDQEEENVMAKQLGAVQDEELDDLGEVESTPVESAKAAKKEGNSKVEASKEDPDEDELEPDVNPIATERQKAIEGRIVKSFRRKPPWTNKLPG